MERRTHPRGRTQWNPTRLKLQKVGDTLYHSSWPGAREMGWWSQVTYVPRWVGCVRRLDCCTLKGLSSSLDLE